MSSAREWREGAYLVTTDPRRVDVDAVVALLATTYWAHERTREANLAAIAASHCYSLREFDGDGDGRQVGFARAVTDWTTFAWIADVVLCPDARGQGLGTFLMRCITEDLQAVKRLVLATRDAHGLYAKVGLGPLVAPERWMERLSS